MARSVLCPKCATVAPSNATVCPKCGTALGFDAVDDSTSMSKKPKTKPGVGRAATLDEEKGSPAPHRAHEEVDSASATFMDLDHESGTIDAELATAERLALQHPP